ncbi:N-acetylglucosamine-6-phosphate deacetylase [Prochlorococcus sp. MIT 1300]|uniref:N-acetylglucosamine-6-phosphate deacetylase n=1 Tax=Prochlorococcus sp. MIT 1300 TaxID=3096218 RepID=UPI002A75A739|nr:N-acetylglucosamine-6-phosphate deacetylase [Prochlorococcus sp. MIT 1300]
MRRITNVRLPSHLEDCFSEQLWWIRLDEEDLILEFGVMPPGSAMSGDDWHGDWLSPMGMDLQMNGGFGLSFSDLDDSNITSLLSLLNQLWIDGVDAICPTIVSCEPEKLRYSLEVLHKARSHIGERCCRLLGAHLEGPFISPRKNGAHPCQYLSEISYEAIEKRIRGFENEISLVTLAPELPGSREVVKRLTKLGIVVCLGHSTANAKEASSAFSNGVSMLTHTFNAMPALTHRDPGPIGAALSNKKIAFGLIADGVHVAPEVLVILQKLASKRLVLVSDALAPYGMEESKYQWDHRKVCVKNRTCFLEDGTLAGSTLSLLEGCRRLALWGNEPSASIWSATMAPRKIFASEISIKEFLLGKPLKHLLRWQWEEELKGLSWKLAA